MRRWSRLFAVALVALSASAAVGFAQGPMPDHLRRSLEATDLRIEQAAAVVATSSDAQAASELALARDVQARAKSAAGGGQYLMAGQLTAKARGHADRAIMLVRGLPSADRVQAQLERTREMLDRYRQRIEECGDDRARAMLRVALEMQGRAESAELSSRHLGALQLTMGARQRGLRALRLCRLEEDLEDTAAQALSRTAEVLARARDLSESGGRGRGASGGREALARATALQDDAARQFRDGRYEASLQLTLTARRLAQRGAGRGPRAR